MAHGDVRLATGADGGGGERGLALLREMTGGRNALLCVALALSFASTWLLNSTGYPAIGGVCPWAQYAAPWVGGVFSLACLLACREWPRLFTSPATAVLTGVVVTLATASMYLGAALGSVALAAVGAVVRFCGCVPRDIILGYALMGLSAPACVAVLLGGYFLRYLFMGLLWLLPDVASTVCLFAFLPCGLALLWPFARPQLERVRSSDTPGSLSITNPLSFLPPSTGLVLNVFLFHAAMGMSTTLGAGGYAMGAVPSLAVFAVVLVAALSRGTRSIDALYRTSFLLALAGLVLVPALIVGEGRFSVLCNAFCETSSSVFALTIWYLTARVGARSLVAALPLMCMVRMGRSCGIGMGSLAGDVVESLAPLEDGLVALFVAALVFGFVAYNFWFARTFSFDATVRGLMPLAGLRPAGRGALATDGAAAGLTAVGGTVGATPADASDAGVGGPADIGASCDALAAGCHLTAREREVLGLLARGRNAAYIQQELTLTRNTVKSYVADVYGKLGVHSHQELIDLVEANGRACDLDGASGRR